MRMIPFTAKTLLTVLCSSPRHSMDAQDEVVSICQEVHEASEPSSVLEFRLVSCRLGHLQDRERVNLPHDHGDYHPTTNLDEVLTDTFHDEARHMEWSQRALLALTLTCCILQMYYTSWICTALTKSQVNRFRYSHNGKISGLTSRNR